MEAILSKFRLSFKEVGLSLVGLVQARTACEDGATALTFHYTCLCKDVLLLKPKIVKADVPLHMFWTFLNGYSLKFGSKVSNVNSNSPNVSLSSRLA